MELKGHYTTIKRYGVLSAKLKLSTTLLMRCMIA